MSIIQSLWIGKSLSVMEILSATSFIKNGDEFHLYAYDDIDNVPEGVQIKDANLILPADKIFKYKKHNSYAGFANMFRYKLLLEKGNYWVDTDIISLKKFDHEDDFLFASAKTPRKFLRYGNTVCNCVMKTPKDSIIMEYCYDKASQKDSSEISWGETGPELLTKAVKYLQHKSDVAKYDLFCPVHWFQWDKLIKKNPNINLIANSDAVHFWNEMWRRANIDKSGKFPEDSIYEILKRLYLE